MKTKILFASLVVGTFLSSPAFAQSKAGGASGGGHVIPAVPRTGLTPVTRPNSTVPSGTTIQNGVNGQSALGQTTGQFSSTATSNGFAGTNTMASTNGLAGTNNFAGTNGLLGASNNVSAFVRPMTNFPITVNSNFNGNIVAQDQAVTPSDRILLTTLSQGIRASLGIAPNGNSPVHFLIQNGTVTVVGTVQSTAQSQAVLSQVQQTPGVTSVINDTHVSGPFAPAVQNGSTGSLGLAAPTDHAFSAADQTLLTTVQQEAALQLGVTSTSQMPVHFSIENGVVGITGQVSSLQEKRALIAAISRTSGITRVVDNVGVAPNSGTIPGSTAAPASATSAFGTSRGGNFGSPGNNVLTPTSRSTATNFLPTTNSSGF
jgi:osmotically-inducible protein OsmY